VISLLFTRANIFDVLEHQQQTLKTDVNRLSSSIIRQVPELQLVHDLAAKYKLEIPVLEEDKAYISHREVDVDVSRDPMRMIFDRGRPFFIKGTEITVRVPFKGNPDIFQIRPSTFNLNPPQGTVQANEIHLVYRRTDNNAAAVKADYQKAIQDINQNLGWLETSISQFNSNIGQRVQTLIGERRQQLGAALDMVAAIGLPVQQNPGQPNAEQHLRIDTWRKSTNSPKKWDVFISHGSEDKNELVRPLATALQRKGASVWYDEFSLKMGDSLRASIDYGLANSRFGVVVLSKNFFAKHWPVQELNGLTTREVKGNKVILPIWHKLGFEEVRAFSPMLADKVAISSDLGVEKLVEEIMSVLEVN
jgi:hypothetical protein